MADAVVGTLRANLILETGQFDAGAKKAVNSISGLTAQAERMVKAFSGNKLKEQADNLVAAVQKIGGASRLTVTEQARVNTTVTQAIEKYRALGQQAPAALLNLANATKGASGPTQFLTAKMVALAAAVGAFVSQMALQAVRALVNFARQSFASASTIVDLANKTGLSTEAIQRMQFVANQTGTSLEAMTEASFRLGVRLDGTSATVKRAVAELGRYGVEWTKLRQMKPEDQFEAVVNALGRVESTQERNRIGVELFGRSFTNVAAAVAEGYGKIAADAKVATDAQLRELDRLNDAWQKTVDNIKTRIGASLGASFEELRVRQEVIADVAKGLLKPWEQTDEIERRLRMLASGAKDIVLPTEQAAAATESYRQQLAKVRAELALLTPAQRAEIAAASDLGVNTDILEDKYGLTAGALRILNSQTKDYETNLKKSTAEADKAAEAQKQWLASISSLIPAFSRWTQVGNDANATMHDTLGLFRVMPPVIEAEAASIEGRLIPAVFGLEAAYEAGARARARLAELMQKGMIAPAFGITSENVSDPAREISAAFALMGQSTRTELQRTADEALRAFRVMQASGEATATALQAAWGRSEAARQAANDESTRGWHQNADTLLEGAEQVFQSLGLKYKAAAIAGAIISTYSAVAKSLASAPWPFNLVLAAGALAAGLANVAMIRKQKAGFQAGTPRLDFQNFGVRSATELHGQEAVIPQGGGHRLAQEIAKALGVMKPVTFAVPQFTMPRFAMPPALPNLSPNFSGSVMVHGGAFGEDIIPRTSPQGSTSPIVNLSMSVNIHGVLDRDSVKEIFRRDIIPMTKQALTLNTDNLLGHTQRVLVP